MGKYRVVGSFYVLSHPLTINVFVENYEYTKLVTKLLKYREKIRDKAL